MRLRASVLIAASAAVAALVASGAAGLPASAAAPARSAGYLPQQAVAVGTGGAVASDDVEATSAGLGVLRRGGNAIDAAVAVAATLGVADPFVAGIGGGGYLVYYNARTHRVSTIDGRETTPRLATSDLFIDPVTGQPLPFPVAVTSGLSVGVPGTLMTWQKALSRWGTKTLAQVLRPAERVARQGFPVDATFREEVRENAGRFAQFSSTSRLFLPGGQLPAVGSTFRNPQLASTYAQIGRRGVTDFYGGPLGADIVQAVRHLPLAPGATLTARPGLMRIGDLRAYASLVRAPTHVNYRGYDVYGMAPSSSGGITTGEALNILSNFDLAKMTRVQALHHYLEASRLAFADRNRYIGDRAFVHVPQRQLLSRGFARQRACLINPGHALTSPVAPGNPFAGSGGCTPSGPTTARQPDEGTNTNHFVVTDRFGDVVSYTNTIEELGGSGIVVPGRGFLLNNELTDFDFTPLQPGVPDPNLPAGGKRPRSSMSPTIVLKVRPAVARDRLARRRLDHHDRAADPAEPHRLRHDAAAGHRGPAGVAAQQRGNSGRVGLHRRADHAWPGAARPVVRDRRHLAARPEHHDQPRYRSRHRPSVPRPRPGPGRRGTGPQRRRLRRGDPPGWMTQYRARTGPRGTGPRETGPRGT